MEALGEDLRLAWTEAAGDAFGFKEFFVGGAVDAPVCKGSFETGFEFGLGFEAFQGGAMRVVSSWFFWSRM